MAKQNAKYCTQLTDYKEDLCGVSACVDAVKGLKADSASPTDVWFVHFDGKTMYEDIPIVDGFMKIWIDVDSAKEFAESIDASYYEVFAFPEDTVEALDYEVAVYRDVIRPLIDKQRCPNFVRYLGSAKQCTFQSLLNILEGSTTADGRKLTTRQWKRRLCRNLEYLVLYKEGRPAIDSSDNMVKPERLLQVFEKLRFNFVMTQPVPEKSVKLGVFLDMTEYSPPGNIIMQLLMALYAMDKQMLSHNDLHSGNVWVSAIPKTTMTYIVNGKRYNMETQYAVKVYDFDRSYSPLLGPNPSMVDQDDLCAQYNQCNSYDEGKDAMKLFYYMFPKGKDGKPLYNSMYATILLNLLTDQENFHIIKHVYSNGQFLKYSDGTNVGPETFSKIRSIEHMISKMYVYMYHGNPPNETNNPDSIFRM